MDIFCVFVIIPVMAAEGASPGILLPVVTIIQTAIICMFVNKLEVQFYRFALLGVILTTTAVGFAVSIYAASVFAGGLIDDDDWDDNDGSDDRNTQGYDDDDGYVPPPQQYDDDSRRRLGGDDDDEMQSIFYVLIFGLLLFFVLYLAIGMMCAHFWFANERKAIEERKANGQPYSKLDDLIMSKFSFVGFMIVIPVIKAMKVAAWLSSNLPVIIFTITRATVHEDGRIDFGSAAIRRASSVQSSSSAGDASL